MDKSITLDQFPVKTYEKLRYGDTDRQGHVNNAVFSSMFETGRVEILYDPDVPLAGPNCAFVIVNLNVDFHAEIKWPGRVEIGTRVSKVGRSSVTFEQALFQDGHLTATAQAVTVQINETTRRSEPLKDAAVERLKGLKSPSAE